jgi:hypothetical protein
VRGAAVKCRRGGGARAAAGRHRPVTRAADSVADASASRPAADPIPPLPYTAADMVIVNAHDAVRLAGTLTLPHGNGPFPAVFLASGSGPQDRDHGNYPWNHRTFLLLADLLTRQGSPCCVSTTAASVNRAETAALLLTTSSPMLSPPSISSRGHSSLDGGRVGIIGHSWGATAAGFAAAQSDGVRFVVTLGGTLGVPFAEAMAEQRAAVGALVRRIAGVPGTCSRGLAAPAGSRHQRPGFRHRRRPRARRSECRPGHARAEAERGGVGTAAAPAGTRAREPLVPRAAPHRLDAYPAAHRRTRARPRLRSGYDVAARDRIRGTMVCTPLATAGRRTRRLNEPCTIADCQPRRAAHCFAHALSLQGLRNTLTRTAHRSDIGPSRGRCRLDFLSLTGSQLLRMPPVPGNPSSHRTHEGGYALIGLRVIFFVTVLALVPFRPQAARARCQALPGPR